MYLEEDEDARRTAELIEEEGQSSLAIEGDVRDSAFCQAAVEEVVEEFGGVNVLVNNARRRS